MIVKSILNRLSIEIFRFSYSKEYERNTVGISSGFFNLQKFMKFGGFKIKFNRKNWYVHLAA